MYVENNVPFSSPYFDHSQWDLLGNSMDSLAQSNCKLKADISNWRKLRTFVKTSLPGPQNEARLQVHATVELLVHLGPSLSDAEMHNAAISSVEIGALAAFALAIMLSVNNLRRLARSLIARFKNRPNTADAEKIDSAPVPQPIKPNPRIPETRLSSSSEATHSAGQKSPKRADSRNSDLLAHLTERLGQEGAEAIINILGPMGKLSAKMISDASNGDYTRLLFLIKSSRKAFEASGKNPDDLLCLLGTEESAETTSGETPPVAVAKRRAHPLDDVPRGGWKRGNFHRLLHSYGFDTSESNGREGHFFVKYGGEKLRTADGRFLIITHVTGNKAMSTGAASSILKYCADFLVEREDRSSIL